MSRTPYDARWRRVRLGILERDGWACQIKGPRCRGRADQVDHIIPLDAGGRRLDPINLRAACATCNASNGTRWRRAKGASQKTGGASRKW